MDLERYKTERNVWSRITTTLASIRLTESFGAIMNSLTARYLSVPGVYDWLMCREPVRDVTHAALDNSFVYSIGLGISKPITYQPPGVSAETPEGNEIEDLLIVTDMCGDFVLGTIYGLSFPHIFAKTPLVQEGSVVCRRFAIDLSRRSELEFVEFVWFDDGKLITMDRTFFHTETGELPTRAEAILFDTVPPGCLPQNVIMRARLFELPDCRYCNTLGIPCRCPFPASVGEPDVVKRIRGTASRKLITTNWGTYVASFLTKARNGRINITYYKNVPGLGEISVNNRTFPVVNILVNGTNHYITMARRKAIHHLGLRVLQPRLESRLALPSLESDFQNLHDAYTVGLSEFVSDGASTPLNNNVNALLKTPTPTLAKRDIFDPVYIEELLDSVTSEIGSDQNASTANSAQSGKDTSSTPFGVNGNSQVDTSTSNGAIGEVYETYDPDEEVQSLQVAAMSLNNPAVQNGAQSVLAGSGVDTTTNAADPTVQTLESYVQNEKYDILGVAKRSVSVKKRRRNTKPYATERDVPQTQFFSCPKCPSMFKSRGDLRRHKATIHDKVKPFECDKCGATFGHRGHLNRHVKTVHLRERPYKCNTCGFRFLQASHLEMHQKMVHEKLKPFKCHICKLSVTTRNALRNHLRHVHDLKESYRCPIDGCKETFIIKFDRDRHLSKVHPLESQPVVQEI